MATVEKTQDGPETPKNAAPEVSVAVDGAKESSSTEAAGELKLTGLRLAAVFTVLCLAVFLVALVSPKPLPSTQGRLMICLG